MSSWLTSWSGLSWPANWPWVMTTGLPCKPTIFVRAAGRDGLSDVTGFRFLTWCTASSLITSGGHVRGLRPTNRFRFCKKKFTFYNNNQNNKGRVSEGQDGRRLRRASEGWKVKTHLFIGRETNKDSRSVSSSKEVNEVQRMLDANHSTCTVIQQ